MVSGIASQYLFVSTQSDLTDVSGINMLTEKERGWYEKKNSDKRDAWLLGRIAAKQSIAKYYQSNNIFVSNKQIEIINTPEGVPRFSIIDVAESLPEPFLTISHNKEYGMACVASRDSCLGLGADIETVRTFDDYILKSFLTTEEYEWCKSKEGREQNLISTMCWSIKESYLKAIGQGLRIHPKMVEIIIDSHSGSITGISYYGKPVHVSIYYSAYQATHVISCIHL